MCSLENNGWHIVSALKVQAIIITVKISFGEKNSKWGKNDV